MYLAGLSVRTVYISHELKRHICEQHPEPSSVPK